MKLLTPDELEAALRDIGARRYHRLHPFHGLLHGGKCTKGQVQAWALNRYYYQAMIPIKDASLIARCEDSGDPPRMALAPASITTASAKATAASRAGCKLTDGLGSTATTSPRCAGCCPATRFAVEAYVHFVREKTLLEAIASSLTELFSPVDHRRARRRHAGELSIRHARDARLFRQAPAAGRARFAISRSTT